MSKNKSRRTVLSVEALEDRATPSSLAALHMPSPVVGETPGSVYGKLALNNGNSQLEIKDFSFGVENPTTIGSATGGAGAGKIKFSEFTIKKTTDSASPAFFKNCCAGAHYDTVIIEMRKAGGDPGNAAKPFLQFKFDTVFTTKIDWSGPGDEGPEESITFVYGKLQTSHLPFLADGETSDFQQDGPRF